MIRHIVLVRFKAELSDSEIGRVLDGITALKEQLGGILAVSTGPNESSEGLEKGFRHGFVVDFVDTAARDAYLPHPAHVRAGQALVDAAEGGIDGILVFDYEI